MDENPSQKSTETIEPETVAGTLPELIRSLNDPDTGVQVRVAKELGELAMKGYANEIAEAGGVKKLIDRFSEGEAEVKNASAHALRNCAEGGAVQRIIIDGGFPILQGMVLYGNWNPSPHVIESLSEMNHPEAILVIQEIVNKKASALERDTFRDVYEMIREPFSSLPAENDDSPDPTHALSELGTDDEFRGRNDKNPGEGGPHEKDPAPQELGHRSVKDTMKHALSPIAHLGSGIKRSLSGDDKEFGHYPDSKGPVKEYISILLTRLDDSDNLGESEQYEILDKLHRFMRRGWAEEFIKNGGFRKTLAILDPPDHDIAPTGDGTDGTDGTVIIGVQTSDVDIRGKVEENIIHMVEDVDLFDVEGSDIVEQLCTGFESSDPYVRSFALRALWELNKRIKPSDMVKKHGIKKILLLLHDPDPEIRFQTIRFLSELGSSRAIKPLREIAEKEGDPDLRRAANLALERLA